ncbi:MAG: MBL fold metallo-hydrolase RNA specificity domain-containing protein [Rhodoluna sp.]
MAVFVVHGESGVAESFSDLVHQKLGWNSRAPKDGDSVVL